MVNDWDLLQEALTTEAPGGGGCHNASEALRALTRLRGVNATLVTTLREIAADDGEWSNRSRAAWVLKIIQPPE